METDQTFFIYAGANIIYSQLVEDGAEVAYENNRPWLPVCNYLINQRFPDR